MTAAEDMATAPAPRANRRWFAATLAAALAIIAAIGTFNACVDPFQQYRIPGRYAARYYTSLHRYIVPGLAKNAAYDTLLSGSSIVENTRNTTIGRACGGVGQNLAMPALTAAEQRLVVGTALASRPLKRAILVLDFNAFSGAVDSRNPLAGPLPAYLYDRYPWNDLPYLLAWGVLVKSWHIATDDRSERFRTDPDSPWWWAADKQFSRSEVIQRLDPRNLNAQFQQPARDLAGMRESFERNLLPLFRDNPATEFDLVWPPYSIIVWADLVQRRQLEVSLAFKRHVFNATRDLANVHLIDLQGVGRITHDLDLYADLYHFAPAVNEWLIEAACGGSYRVDAGNVDALERDMRAQSWAFDPASLSR